MPSVGRWGNERGKGTREAFSAAPWDHTTENTKIEATAVWQ
jgi:hypothetical protein